MRQKRWASRGEVRKTGGERGEREDRVDGRVRVKRLRARSGKVDGERTKRKADGKEEVDDRGGRLRVRVRRNVATAFLREVVRYQPSAHDGAHSREPRLRC